MVTHFCCWVTKKCEKNKAKRIRLCGKWVCTQIRSVNKTITKKTTTAQKSLELSAELEPRIM